MRSGSIRLRGHEITGQPAHKLVRLGVGFVPQTKNVFQTLTVRENLEMGCFLTPKRFAERYEVVTGLFPRLAERADQKAGSLSGGERQMVAMGRALMLDPTLLLLDEPSAGLSPMLQDEVFLRCKLINDTGVAILMVEQNARRCLQVCHRGYVLDQGRNAYTRPGPRAAHRPQGDRALPRHAGAGLTLGRTRWRPGRDARASCRAIRRRCQLPASKLTPVALPALPSEP